MKQEDSVSAKPVIIVTARLPASLKEWLDKRAAENRRSRHGELLYILESAKRSEEGAECEA